MSSATTTVEPRSPSFSQMSSSWGGRVGLLSLTSSITRMTVPVLLLEAEIKEASFDYELGKPGLNRENVSEGPNVLPEILP